MNAHTTAAGPGAVVDPRVCHLATYLLANSEKPVCLHDLARRVNLSDSRLAHIFRRDLGITLQQFLKTVRLRRARRLLETTFLSVKQVMVRVGLNDSSHFVRDFEQMFGESPRNYRKSHMHLRFPVEPESPTNSRNGQ
ncbi:MAG: helix-turn-helix domain-containing protein [Chlamydiota bacterium]